MSQKGWISWREARCRLGSEIYGDEWIDNLTAREQWLLKRYLDEPGVGSIFDGRITYVGPGGTFPRTNDPKLAAEVERARDRRAWRDEQDEYVANWLESRGFDTDSIDTEAFCRAVASAFPSEAAGGDKSPRMSTASAKSVPAETTSKVVYRTGVAGRPTSWHLIEAECRRRYGLGERYQKVAEWGRVLIAWLEARHPDAPRLTQKTLTNKLPPLLRELEADRLI